MNDDDDHPNPATLGQLLVAVDGHTKALHATANGYRSTTRAQLVLTGILIVLGLVLISYAQSNHDLLAKVAQVSKQIDDCTGSNPRTECRKQQAASTTPVVNGLRLSTDCTTLYALGKEPEPCKDVIARLKALEQNIDPFTTTTTGGTR